jgi:serine/threonine protein phosphatase 1
MLTYAVPDIHGRADLLLALLERIRDHAPRDQQRRIVFLGDYVNRGPDSAAVVITLRKLQEMFPRSVVCLAGNHEDLLLAALSDRQHYRRFIEMGGQATLDSYGVAHLDDIPRDVIHWLAERPTLFADDLRYFVHAGLHPARPIEPENREDRLWIREPFLETEHDFGKHVVHGHTPLADGPDVRRYRTNLDTGAVRNGRLVAGVFGETQAPALEFIEVRGPA